MTDLTSDGDERQAWRVVAVTSAEDGLEHLVADEAMALENAGRYVALCGRAVLAAALVCPPGRPCRACVEVRTSDAASGRQQRRVGMWAWLNPIRRHRHRAAAPTPLPDVTLPVCEPEFSRFPQGLVLPAPVHQSRPCEHRAEKRACPDRRAAGPAGTGRGLTGQAKSAALCRRYGPARADEVPDAD